MAEEKSVKLPFRDIVEFLFIPLLSACVFILWDLNKSVSALNVQVGILIANNSTNEKRMDALEKRIERIEDIKTGNVARK